MSVYNPHRRITLRITMAKSTLDKLFGFLSGVIAMGIVGLIIGVTYIESNGLSLMGVALATAALVTLLLLRDVPINEINISKTSFTIDFEVQNSDGSDDD